MSILGEKHDFAEKTFADCALVPHQRTPRLQISRRKTFANSHKTTKFSPSKVSRYTVVCCAWFPVDHHGYQLCFSSPGNQYNIPIAIWLKQTHPYHCPIIFVTPTQDMGIQQSQFVDSSGMVFLPYLTEWKQVGGERGGERGEVGIKLGKEGAERG